jgi:hypothetical protein
MTNLNDEVSRIQEQIDTLERTTLESFALLRNMSNIHTSTPVTQSNPFNALHRLCLVRM